MKHRNAAGFVGSKLQVSSSKSSNARDSRSAELETFNRRLSTHPKPAAKQCCYAYKTARSPRVFTQYMRVNMVESNFAIYRTKVKLRRKKPVPTQPSIPEQDVNLPWQKLLTQFPSVYQLYTSVGKKQSLATTCNHRPAALG